MFDVIVIPVDNYDGVDIGYPRYTFYSSLIDRNITVSVRSDGDSSSPYETIEEAVRVENGLSVDPELHLRDDEARSELDLTYSVNANKQNANLYVGFEETLRSHPSDENVAGILRTIQSIVERAEITNSLNDNTISTIISLLRRAGLNSINDLDGYFAPIGNDLSQFMTVERIMALEYSDLQWLQTNIPELSNYINFSNISTVTQSALDSASRSIPDLGQKLGFATTSRTLADTSTIDQNLGSRLKNLSGVSDYLDKTDSRGVRLFPDGISTPNIVQSGVTVIPENFQVSVQTDTTRSELDRLLQQGQLTTNPVGSLIDHGIDAANTTLRELGSIESDKIPLLVDAIRGSGGISLPDALSLFKDHTDKLTTVTPPKSSTVSPTSTEGFRSLIENPIDGLVPASNGGKIIAGMFDASKNRTISLASTVDTDFDGVDPASGFAAIAPTSVMGSVLSHEYILLLQELIEVLEETRNYSTTQQQMRQGAQSMLFRASLLKPFADVGNEEYRVYYASAIKAQQYFDMRANQNIPLDVFTETDRRNLSSLVSEWAAPLVGYYKKAILAVIASEINGYRSAYASSNSQNILDKTKSSSQLMNALLTPEANAVIRKPSTSQSDIVRVTVPEKRIPDSFVDGFSVLQLTDPDVDPSGRRLRNYDRDYKGEIVTITNNDIYDNLYNLTNSILKPLADAGYSFDILRGLRRFDLTGNIKGAQNNTDHHYGLAVDIRLHNQNLTGEAVKFIHSQLPWNKLVVYNYNNGSLVNDGAFIHISHYWKQNHGWEKNWDKYPTKNGYFAEIGGNGVSIFH